MIHRTVKVLLWVLCGLGALIVVLSGLLVWRLSAAPVSLGFFTPYLEKALTEALAGHRVAVQETVLAWNTRRHNLDLRARAVTIHDRQGSFLATLPAVDVTLSRRALLRGTVAVTAINIEGAQVSLIRDTDGAILFGAATASDVIAMFTAEANPSPLLASLQELRISNGGLTVQDRQTGGRWKVPQADFVLRRDHEAGTARLQMTTVLQDIRTTIDATLTSQKAAERLRLDASFAQLRLSTLAVVVPRFNGLAGFDVPLDGTLSMALDRHGTLHDLHFEIGGGPGWWSVAEVFPQPQPIATVMARGSVDGTSGTLQLDGGTLTFGTATTTGVTLNLRGTAAGLKADHTSDELTAQLEMTLASQNARTTFATELSYGRTTKQLHMNTAFTNLRVTLLATAIPALRQLAGFEVPLDGTLTATLEAPGRLSEMRFAVSGGAGRFSYPDILPEPRPISQVRASGRLDGQKGTFRLDNATVTFGQGQVLGPILKISGNATGVGGDVTAQGRMSLEALSIAHIGYYWPKGASPKARAWIVENIVAGMVEQAQADVVLTLPGGTFAAAKVERLSGTLRYQECQVHYLRPLPPVTGVSGDGSFNLQGFRLGIEHGTTASQTISGGKVTISGLDQRRDAIAIEVDVAGPLREALMLLNHPRLDLLSDLRLHPETISGQIAVQLAFAFSLIGSVHLENVEISARGKIESVSIQNVFQDHAAEQGDVSLDLDKHGMTLKGPVVFAAVPLTLNWKEAFTKQAAWRSEIHAAARQVSHADLVRLGLDLTGYVGGAFAADITAKMDWAGQSEVHAALDLQGTSLVLPFLSWNKAVGESGKAHGMLQLVDGRPVTVQQFEITAGTLATRGIVQFNQADRSIASFELSELAFDNSTLSNVSVQLRDEGVEVTVGAGILDARPLLHRRINAEENPTKETATRDRANTSEHGAVPRIHVHAPELHQVFFGSERYLQNVQVEIRRGKTGWELIDVAGQVPSTLVHLTRSERQAMQQGAQFLPRAVSVRYQPSPQGTYSLVAHTNDLGSLLRALNVSENVTSGQMLIEGHTTSPGANDSLQATVEVKRFEVKDAPILAQILAAASLPGLLNLLQSDGMMFSRLAAEITLANGTMAINQLHGHGGSLGLTAQGEVRTAAGDINLKGTIIPAYGINSLLGHIPVLNLLVGGKHQGLVAVAYRLTGSLTDPQVSVNPATALTPGFLRHVFDLLDDRGSNDVEDFPTNTSSAADE